MINRIVRAGLAAVLLALAAPALAQLPPASGVVINQTPVQGGSAGQCLFISSGKVSSQACGGAPSGTAGGDLTGTYPNPTLASGSASVLNSGTVAAARGGAGTITGALKGNGAGVVSQAACADLSNAGTGCSAAVTSVGTAAVGQIPGTATNDNATAGNLGEYRSASNADTGTAFGTSTVTITIASPAVVTWGTTTPFVFSGNGTAVINFTTTGALPTGIVAGTNYYVIGSSVSGNSFQIATSAANALAGTAINTSGSQSGVQTGAPTALLGTGVVSNVAAMSLTAGDWDIDVDIGLLAGGTTSITLQQVGTGLVSATADTVPGRQSQFSTSAMVPGLSITAMHAGPARYSFSSTTTVFCTAQGTFTVSTLVAYGGCHARRAR